jgi:hypothetical protein
MLYIYIYSHSASGLAALNHLGSMFEKSNSSCSPLCGRDFFLYIFQVLWASQSSEPAVFSDAIPVNLRNIEDLYNPLCVI